MRTDFINKLKPVVVWIKEHKYVFVTLVFLVIILLLDENSMLSHMRNKAVINELTNEIKEMEADSADVQAKLKLYTDQNLSVIEDVAREQGLVKKNEEVFIIRK